MQTSISRRALGALMAGAAVAALTGCKMPSANPAAVAAAEAAYANFWRGEDKALAARLAPPLRNAQTLAQLDKLRAMVPSGPPRASTLVSWRSFTGTGGRQITLVHRYDYAEAAVTVTTVLVPGEAEDAWLVQTFNLNLGLPPSQPEAPAPGPKGEAV